MVSGKRKYHLYLGNCLEVMQIFLEDNSVDAIVTDPPYGLKFMSKKWDYDVPSIDIWREALRVLKPGGYLLSFGGTRTYHRMVVNIEDAGFEIRDQIQWLYGSGFPKSYNISKGIDKKAGAERKVIGPSKHHCPGRKPTNTLRSMNTLYNKKDDGKYDTASSTDLAKQWDGFGTALKPANEPIVLARKPLSEKNIVANVLRWGTGGLNIDGCRVGYKDQNDIDYLTSHNQSSKRTGGPFIESGSGTNQDNPKWEVNNQGRFPANLILDEQAAKMLDEQSGISKEPLRKEKVKKSIWGSSNKTFEGIRGHGDSGGASRFFYVAKASKAERNAGLEGMPEKLTGNCNSINIPLNGKHGTTGKPNKPMLPQQNNHPTVKPLKLMTYLCRLITPPGGVILDPFMGSGTTGISALKEVFQFIGIEKEKEYCEIAEKRIKNTRIKKGKK